MIARARGCGPCGVSSLTLSVIATAASTQPNTTTLSTVILAVPIKICSTVDVDCEGNSDLCHSGRWQLRQLSDVQQLGDIGRDPSRLIL